MAGRDGDWSDDGLRDDVRSVLNAAALLDITEFELFRLAHRRWHGEEAEARAADRVFAAYMFADQVPSWVRHFTREVEAQDAQGRLDREAFGVRRTEGSAQMVSRGVRYAVVVSTALATLIVLAESAARLLAITERCLFPPCY